MSITTRSMRQAFSPPRPVVRGIATAGFFVSGSLITIHPVLTLIDHHTTRNAHSWAQPAGVWLHVPLPLLELGLAVCTMILVYPGTARGRKSCMAPEYPCTSHPTPAAIVHAHGDNPISSYALEPDKAWFASADGASGVAYRCCAGVALAAGEPLAALARRPEVAVEFAAFARRRGLVPAFYQVLHKDIEAYQARGMRALKIGEEAMIDLPSFTLTGSQIANVRHCVTHVEREGLRAEVYQQGVNDEETLDGLAAVSRAWLAARSSRGEMGFSMGSFCREAMRRACVALARDPEGRVCAFVTFRWVEAGRGVVLDLMRRDSTCPSGTIDFLLARALEHFRDAGLAFASLSLAPLANVRVDGHNPQVECLLAMLAHKANGIYRYRSLHAFKQKFAPRWEPRYLVYPAGPWNLVRVLLAMALVHLPHGMLHRPSSSGICKKGLALLRQSLHWRVGLLPEALGFNLRMLALGTLIFSLPEWWTAIGVLGRHHMALGYTVLALALAACDTVGGVALARRHRLGRLLLAPAAVACLVKMAWELAARYDHGWLAWTVDLVVAPIEIWVLWFLLQPEVRSYLWSATTPTSRERPNKSAA